MATKDWIALGFSIALLLFLVIAFFIRPHLTRSQHTILHFLTAAFAAFAGSLWTGKAFFEGKGTLSTGMEISISATAGIAVFLIVWFTYPKHVPVLKDAFNFSIPENWTFEGAVQAIVKTTNGVHELTGFSPEQLSLKLESRHLETRTALEALKRLQYLNNQLPRYEVTLSDGIYTFKKL